MEYERNGWARRLSEKDLEAKVKPVHYLPHHGIYRPDKKSTPLSTVFDLACQYPGVSLNSKGPGFINWKSPWCFASLSRRTYCLCGGHLEDVLADLVTRRRQTHPSAPLETPGPHKGTHHLCPTLIPNHLLLGRASSCVPQGPFKEGQNPRKRFEFVQSLAHQVWKRFIREYGTKIVYNH